MAYNNNMAKSAAEFARNVVNLCSDTGRKPPEQEYIEKYQLDKPENLIKFIIEIYFDSFESVIDGLGDIRVEMLGEVTSHIDTAKKNLIYAYENPTYREEKLRESHSALTNVTSKLEEKLRQYAGELEKINNRDGLKSLIFSPFDLTKVKNITAMAKTAVTSYFEAIFLLTIIDNSRKANGNMFIRQADIFIHELENKKYISLFLDYDKNKSDIWNIKNMKNIIERTSLISAGFDDYVNKTIQYNNNDSRYNNNDYVYNEESADMKGEYHGI